MNKYLPGLALRHPTTWKYAVPRPFELNGMDLNVVPTVEPDLAERVDLDVPSILRTAPVAGCMPMFPREPRFGITSHKRNGVTGHV
jgi:hypothetical protein